MSNAYGAGAPGGDPNGWLARLLAYTGGGGTSPNMGYPTLSRGAPAMALNQNFMQNAGPFGSNAMQAAALTGGAQPPMPVPDVTTGQPVQPGGGSSGGGGASSPIPMTVSDAGSPPTGASLLDQSGVTRMGGPSGVLNTQPPTGASAPSGAGLPDLTGISRTPQGVLTTAPTPRPARVRPAARIPATARAQVPGTGAGSPFTWQARPNAPDGGGRGSLGGPANMTMLDLSQLFGRRSP